MTPTKGKDILSSDLDIFGGGADEDTKETGGEYDIFGGEADSQEATPSDVDNTVTPTGDSVTTDSPEDVPANASKDNVVTDETTPSDVIPSDGNGD